MTVTIALGSNLGDRHATLVRARELVCERIGSITGQSEVLETAAWGNTEQPDFANQVIVVEHTPDAQLPLRTQLLHLLDLTQGIENDLGRARKEHWGPRTCDLDLIFVDDVRYEDERLSLPHPWWSVREFVGGIIRRELPEVLPLASST